jgi:hypothetical protein
METLVNIVEGDFAVNAIHQLCWVVSFLKIHDGYEDG